MVCNIIANDAQLISNKKLIVGKDDLLEETW